MLQWLIYLCNNLYYIFRPFSGLIHDGRRWRSRLFGDLRDAIHWNSLAAILFLYFVTVTLAVSQGEELSQLTEYEMVSSTLSTVVLRYLYISL